MAISTYAELQTAITNWLIDTVVSARVPEFITLAESRINRDLGNIRTAWTNASLTGTLSSRSVSLPSTYIEPQALFLTTYGDQIKLTPFVNGTMELRTANGIPAAWSINGANIDLDCPCDQAHTFLFRHRAKWELSGSATTNWLLTNHPDVYLSASLVEAFKFRRNLEAAMGWNAVYKQTVDEIEQKEGRNLAVAPLMTDPALLPRQGGVFNFTIGE